MLKLHRELNIQNLSMTVPKHQTSKNTQPCAPRLQTISKNCQTRVIFFFFIYTAIFLKTAPLNVCRFPLTR